MCSVSSPQWWLIGPELGSSVAGMVISSQAQTPSALPARKWFVYDNKMTNGWMEAPDVRVACHPVPYVDVKVQMKAKDCSDANKRAMAAMQFNLNYALTPGASNLVSAMRHDGFSAMSATLVGKPVTRDCAPEILVDVPHPKHAHSLQVHCHYNGHRVMVTHQKAMHHDTFNCYHRFDEMRSVWDCRCHSWQSASVSAGAGIEYNYNAILNRGPALNAPKTAVP